jgi:hypothetical protein
MRTSWTSNPRPLSTNDGPRALVLFYGFQRPGTTILKRLTPVTLFLHVKRAVHLKKQQSRFAISRRSRKQGAPARDEKYRKAKSKGHENRRKLRWPVQRAEKSCSVVAPIYTNERWTLLGALECRGLGRSTSERTLEPVSWHSRVPAVIPQRVEFFYETFFAAW